jgi:hypothetical protein
MRPIRDYPPDDYDAVIDGPSRFARLRRAFSTGIGAAVALGLMLALGVWFYRLGVRDAENVPIIRASAEPTKTRPEEPGGVVTPYQDITSYRVAESRVEPPTPIFAPPPPEPRPEDVAMGKLAPRSAVRPAERRTADHEIGAAPDDAVNAPPDADASRSSGEETDAEASAQGFDVVVIDEEVGAGEVSAAATPMSEADEIAALVRAATLDAAAAPKPAVAAGAPAEGGPALPPLPPARPSDLLARVDEGGRWAARSAAELARRAAESPVQIQLAADPDEQVVRSLWRRIARANQDILHDRELAVQPTISGGTTYYRLRVGPFSGASEAHAVCEALQARGQDCIVARNG